MACYNPVSPGHAGLHTLLQQPSLIKYLGDTSITHVIRGVIQTGYCDCKPGLGQGFWIHLIFLLAVLPKQALATIISELHFPVSYR
jgi:hypothetical protein